ncbi:aldo/keto reductase [Pseudomonas sp. Choline-3u-10]|jgi:D-threo-aldose 1-dehydrogenase|uniref:aldo/keto reductase n=1 Tax=Pseudomonadaceae TaxID=135621 RepID=UPI000617DF9F|nr:MULTISPECIES: aldo/keto reductase [Pseudomonadaceae]MAL35499.1 aldo/keto reductase [Pseudomonas sp.]MBU0950749.1 aldo/keto reductase [Gammaproteobacteria bacterium]KJJ65231.1 D-threo-aldose 1-dehydrogenase [Pseudomonas sp. 10B238]MBK3795539.1 aldo/keto reductase [Stutzerimonas stutzeri]MBK3878106.1 aldo/keto reductase [Stutzerimonas stutzeri]|tara:strand:+ start:112 stop:1083 length:972 start_codon:yes stop_codon:yes gene_type:complete
MRIPLPRLGFGGAPLGNMFAPLDETTADATLKAAWDAGIRYYDTSPHYGAGLAEQRFGRLLSKKPRDEFVLSTKVGRLLQPTSRPENAPPFVDELPNKRVVDYSADGARRSIEDSLERMGVNRIDVAFIHDVSEDQWGPQWTEYFQQAMQGAAKALTQMREEGLIRGWGLGVNLVEPCRMALEQSDPDVFLLAGRYSLLDHREALDTLFPKCVERGVGIVVGGPFNSGVLAGGEHYDYAAAPDDIRQKTGQIEAVCQEFEVDIRAAALQFCLAHPAVLSAIPGTSNPKRPAQYVQQFEADIPAEFWRALKDKQLLPEDVPVPG